MKPILAISLILFSSFLKTHNQNEEQVFGTWKGFYGTEKIINPITVKIDLDNKADVVYNFNEEFFIAKGTYQLLGDSAIIISCQPPGQKTPEVILHGNLNRTSSFIDGQWDGIGKQGGCFYLQKQFTDPRL